MMKYVNARNVYVQEEIEKVLEKPKRKRRRHWKK